MLKELGGCWKVILGLLIFLVLMPDFIEVFVLFAYIVLIALILISGKFKKD